MMMLMWSLVGSMVGCAPSGPEAYAGCTVVAVSEPTEWAPMEEQAFRYDAEGRLVEERIVTVNSLYPDGVEALEEHTYEGECVVRTRGRHESPHSRGAGDVRRECDEHGHVERSTTESAWEWGGERYRSSQTDTWVYEHDAQGRLVSVTKEGGWVAEYDWDGLCEEPSVTRNFAGGILYLVESQVCNVAGKGIEGERETFDPDGERSEFYRWRREYDISGRLLSEERDRGPATDIFLRVDYAYDDPDAPGPTEMVTEYEGEITQRVTYTYDCEG